MARQFRRHRKWSSLTGDLLDTPEEHQRLAVIAICGEHMDPALRHRLARSTDTSPGPGPDTDRVRPDIETVACLVVVEELCAHPERLGSLYQRHRPAAVVVAACSLDASRAAAAAAVADGADTARVVAASLAPALERGPAERAPLVTASCHAWSQRAVMLVGAPLAGHAPWQPGQPLDRRSLLGAWRGRPSYRARVDERACVGTERCGRCTRECPTGAFTVSGTTPQVDPRSCVSCGRCVTMCPSRAISMPGADLDGIAVEVESLLEDGISDIAIVCRLTAIGQLPSAATAERGPEATILLPCVATLGPGALLGLSASGVRVRVETCSACPAHEEVQAVSRFAGRLAGVLGTGFLDNGAGVGPATIRLPDTAGGENRANTTHVTWHEPDSTKAFVAQLAGAQNLRPAKEMLLLDEGAPTFVVTVDGARCTVCAACTLACPSTALMLDPPDGALQVDSSQCVGCRRCVDVCPEAAVLVERGIDVDAVVGGPVLLELPSRPWICPDCGKSTGTDPLVASVRQRLAAHGRSPALIASLGRCSACSEASRANGALPRPTVGEA